jgi:acyl-CoA dehydrogenase
MTAVTDTDTALLVDAAERLFAERWPLGARVDLEPDRLRSLWADVAATGFLWISVPEASGGSGGTLTDAAAVLRVAGRFAVPLPLAETAVLAGWLLALAGLPAGEASASVVLAGAGDRLELHNATLTGVVHRVPWARSVDRLVLLIAPREGGPMVACVPAAAASIEPGDNLAGEPRDTVSFDHVPVQPRPLPNGVDEDSLLQRAALTRVLLMAGALERMAELTMTYAEQRRQFGRPIRAFQAVQAHLVAIAQDVALVAMAADLAVEAAERGPAEFEIGSAKLLANQAATRATRAAHQAHGAIGMTQEYPLHLLSRRLWSWRAEYGSERYWSGRVGGIAAAVRADGLYRLISDGSSAELR